MTEPESWVDAEPGLRQREHEAMAASASDMDWREDLRYRGRPVVGWAGLAPA